MKRYSHLIGKKVSYKIDERPGFPSSPEEPAVLETWRGDVVVGLFSLVSVDGGRREKYATMASGERVSISSLFIEEAA